MYCFRFLMNHLVILSTKFKQASFCTMNLIYLQAIAELHDFPLRWPFTLI